MTKKLETPITLANGGLHSPKQYKKAVDMLMNNPYTAARLYHVVFKGSQKPEDYAWVRKILSEHLRDKGIENQWHACLEVEEAKGGLHMHMFLMAENHGGKCVSGVIKYAAGGWLQRRLAERRMSFHIAEPKNAVHRNGLGKVQKFATLTKGPRLDDAIIWISYPFKARTKDASVGRIYFSSHGQRKESKQPTFH